MLIFLVCLFVLFVIHYVWNIFSYSFSTDRWGVYRDGNGVDRWKKNKHPVIYIRDLNGNLVLKDLKDNKTIINITHETAKWYKRLAEHNDRTVYLCMCEGNNEAKIINKNLVGNRYRDLKTGQYYVGRRYEKDGRCGYFYMDMKTYKFTRSMDLTYKTLSAEQLQKQLKDASYLIKVRNNEVDNLIKYNSATSSGGLYLNHLKWNEDYVFNDSVIFNREEIRRF